MKRRRSPGEQTAYFQAQRRVAILAGWECQADGIHHPSCPGKASVETLGQFVTHHVRPRSRGGTDDDANLRWVWNGLTGLGAGGCHGRIHNHPNQAELLGLLDRTRHPDPDA